jgi:hypothetical protein
MYGVYEPEDIAVMRNALAGCGEVLNLASVDDQDENERLRLELAKAIIASAYRGERRAGVLSATALACVSGCRIQ